MSDKKAGKLLWVDLEMTGLSPSEDRIVEVAAIVTDWDLNEIATFQAIKKVNADFMRTRMIGPFWDTFSHVREQLIAQNEEGKESEIVEKELLGLIEAHFIADQPVLLAGNSIHQDRKFIENEWPLLNARLHYRMLDVSAWKVVFEGKYRKKFAKPEEHRAMEDIRGSILELKYYLGKVRP